MKLYIFILWSFIVISSCGSPRRVEPIRGAMVLNEQTSRGMIVYMQNCQKCHPHGEGGIGLPINNIHLPGFATRFRIRNKSFLLGLGRMPSFKEHEISRDQMDDLISYIKVLRKNKTTNTATANK